MDGIKPKDHPTKTKCCPAIVAVRDYGGPQTPLEKITWTHVEATGEEDFEQPKAEAEAQESANTTYHLQARPDLVSVVGILTAIEWTDAVASQLLCAWMWRLHHPELDPTIAVNLKTSPPTFIVKTSDGQEYDQLVILHAGESIGRRSTILAQVDSSSSIIIKEQYIERGDGFREGPILDQIHEDGQFPGVIGLNHYEYVKDDNKRISIKHRTNKAKVVRSKVRLILKGRGVRLIDVKTPRVLLMGMYDLLESECPLPPLALWLTSESSFSYPIQEVQDPASRYQPWECPVS
jgi:hypothetical protein